MELVNNKNEIDLHWIKDDPDLGIASEGVFLKDASKITQIIAKVKDTVKKINLDSQSAFKNIPAVLGECKCLEELNLSHTGIENIPDFVFELPALRSLSCRCSELDILPASISKAQNLESLYVRVNKGSRLPAEITSLKNLKVLSLDLYSDEAFPAKLGNLSNLEEFTLSIKYDEGSVPALPDSFKNHPALKKIIVNDIFYRKRKTIEIDRASKILASCKNFTSLNISGFDTGKSSKHFSRLTGLKELELRHLLVEGNIFDSIKGLTGLEKLCILGSDFKIAAVPDIFADMKGLRDFTFAGNMVFDIPPSIYTLTELKTFEFGCTAISHIDEKITNLQNLESIQIHDNLLEKLPANILSLPNLKILNIEENLFTPGYIKILNEKIKAAAQKGRKIDLFYDRQGYRQNVKRLRGIRDIKSMDTQAYAKCCVSAVVENPYAIKYVNAKKLKDTPHYVNLCAAAIKKSIFVLENIDHESLGRQYYFHLCMEAAKSQEIGNYFKLIRADLLNDSMYIQICMEAALNNRSADFIDNFNTEAFQKRFSREVYERICWISVLHHPKTFLKMVDPTEEIKKIAGK